MGLADIVVFPGFRSDVTDLMIASDVLLFPSFQEGDPNTVKEAMACGLPTVGFAAGDTAYVVRDGKDGYIVPVGDEVALQERLCKLVLDNPLRHLVGESARQRAFAEFGIEETARAIEKALVQAVRGNDQER